jgi:hypothetical protein
MAIFCLSCRTPLSSTDRLCPACGASPGGSPRTTAPPRRVSVGHTPVTDGASSRVPGRAVTGTVVQFGAVRQDPVMGRTLVRNGRIGAAAAVLALVGVLVIRGPSWPPVLVTAAGLLILLVLGLLLRAAMPAECRSSAHDGRFVGVLWPWTLPLRLLAVGRTVDVLPFLVKDVAGDEHHCEVRGGSTPGSPTQGDVVEVYGRRNRAGTVRVRQLVDVATRRATRPRAPFACGLTRMTGSGVTVVWTAVAVVLLWILAVGR